MWISYRPRRKLLLESKWHHAFFVKWSASDGTLTVSHHGLELFRNAPRWPYLPVRSLHLWWAVWVPTSASIPWKCLLFMKSRHIMTFQVGIRSESTESYELLETFSFGIFSFQIFIFGIFSFGIFSFGSFGSRPLALESLASESLALEALARDL